MTPPRLHVIPAIGCEKALVLRRGPTDAVASLLWDRKTDRFEMGQWLKGRIYEHRCDISPDGCHMVIFARRPDASLAWTSVSRTPWMRAVGVWPQDSSLHGGGAFAVDGALWLNSGMSDASALPDGLTAAAVDAYPHSTDGFHMGDLFAAMMVHRGWQHLSGSRYETILTKSICDDWQVELGFSISAQNRAIISNHYTLVNEAQSLRIPQPDWEWADTYTENLQFASQGRLCEAVPNTDGFMDNVRVIRDFSDMTFEAIKAPYAGCETPEWGR